MANGTLFTLGRRAFFLLDHVPFAASSSSSSSLLFPKGHNITGGKCIWLLNVLDDDRTTIGIEYYDLQNHNVIQVSTCYHFSVFCLISPNYKLPFFKMLFETFGESIHMIGDSNLRLECYPNTLLDCLLQVNQSERVTQYDLITIKCISQKTCIHIHEFLKTNLKPYYQCVNSLETSYILMMHLFLEANTIEQEHPSITKSVIPFRLKFLQSKISPNCYRNNHDMKKAFCYFDPTRIFVANGLYIFNIETLRLQLFSTNTAELYKLLPMIAFRIETIADNMIDIPTGCSENEEIVSYVLIATHFEQAIICVNYLRFLSPEQREMMTKNRRIDDGSTEWWKERDKQLTEKYQRQFHPNYRELNIWVESYDTEMELLESFIQLYSRGQLLQALVHNSRAKHFFTGHDIIKRDMPFLLRRFKWHQMHQHVEDYVTYDVSSLGFDSESIIVKFHRNAYFIDSYRIFQQQHLSLTSPREQEVNPLLVRIYYILGIMLQDEREERVLEFLQQITKSAFGEKFTVPLDQLPRNVHNCLTKGNLNINQLDVYPFNDFLANNIENCKFVLDLWQKFNYPKLFSLITQIYPCNLEKALQANVTTRIKIAFDYIAIKYRQILPAGDFSSIGKKRRYLFHSRLNESLIYKSSQIYENLVNGIDFIHPNREGDDCVEIDDSRYQRNVDKFFLQVYTEHPVVDLVKYKSTKKKYPGAAVIVFPGIYRTCFQIDIISQYPNILLGKQIFTDAVDICTAGSMQKILTDSSTFRETFSSWIRTDCIQIYQAEDNDTFASYLKDFSFDNFEKGKIVGQLIVNVDILMNLSSEQPLLIYCPDGRSFLNHFTSHLLKLRKSLHDHQERGTNGENLPILETMEKFIKRTVNSVYGLFGLVHIPVAAIITMFGRKILIFASKFLPVLTLQLLMQHLKIWHWFHSVCQVDLLSDVEVDFNDGMLRILGEKFNSCLVNSLSSASGRGKFRTTCQLLLEHFSVNFDTIFENTSRNDPIFNETSISLLRLRCLLDGQTSVQVLNETRGQIQRILNDIDCENKDYIQDIFNALPLALRNCVFDCDTDGLQFVNTFQLNGKLILELLNDEIGKVFQMDNIIFREKQHAYVFSLAKKKYTTFDFDPICGSTFLVKNQQHVIYIDNCCVKHVGYQKNALPCFKYLCNYVAIICLLIHRGKALRFYKFREIVWSVFNYLECLAPGELYVRVKLNNRQRKDSARGRFINKYTQTYNGVLRAVYVVNGDKFCEKSFNDVPLITSTGRKHLERLVLLDDYVWNVKHQRNNANSDKMQLHYGFFLRNFGNIWYKQYCLSTSGKESNCGSQELRSTVSIINQYFDDWLSRTSELRRVDDLDDFLSNRFIVIKESSLS